MSRLSTSCILAFSLVFSSVTPAFSAPMKVNPAVLQKELIAKNLTILQALNQVQQAKIKINLARTQLLPSLNLGLTGGGGNGFFVSTISVLMPFLVPNNWFNYSESQYLFEAEKSAFYLMELNLYASVLSTYSTIVGDMGLRRVLKSQYDNLNRVVSVIQARKDFGMASESELLNARAQAKLARVQLSQVDQLLASERATLREAMALPLVQDFIVEEVHIKPPTVESENLTEIAKKALYRSPEHDQINFLIAAGEDGNWKQVFAFFNSGALSSMGGAGNSASFSKLAATANFNLGFSMVPAYQLSNTMVEQLRLRRQEIVLENNKVVEQAITGIREATLQLSQASQAEASLRQVFEVTLENYNLGYTDLLHVLDAQRSVTQASTAKIKATVELDSMRINLQRALVSDQFKTIPACTARYVAKKEGFFQRIQNFFSTPAIQKSVEEMCRG